MTPISRKWHRHTCLSIITRLHPRLPVQGTPREYVDPSSMDSDYISNSDPVASKAGITISFYLLVPYFILQEFTFQAARVAFRTDDNLCFSASRRLSLIAWRLSLPFELHLHILGYLDLVSLLNATATNHYFHDLLSSRVLKNPILANEPILLDRRKALQPRLMNLGQTMGEADKRTSLANALCLPCYHCFKIKVRKNIFN
jgi:hypothetical protein